MKRMKKTKITAAVIAAAVLVSAVPVWANTDAGESGNQFEYIVRDYGHKSVDFTCFGYMVLTDDNYILYDWNEREIARYSPYSDVYNIGDDFYIDDDNKMYIYSSDGAVAAAFPSGGYIVFGDGYNVFMTGIETTVYNDSWEYLSRFTSADEPSWIDSDARLYYPEKSYTCDIYGRDIRSIISETDTPDWMNEYDSIIGYGNGYYRVSRYNESDGGSSYGITDGVNQPSCWYEYISDVLSDGLIAASTWGGDMYMWGFLHEDGTPATEFKYLTLSRNADWEHCFENGICGVTYESGGEMVSEFIDTNESCVLRIDSKYTPQTVFNDEGLCVVSERRSNVLTQLSFMDKNGNVVMSDDDASWRHASEMRNGYVIVDSHFDAHIRGSEMLIRYTGGDADTGSAAALNYPPIERTGADEFIVYSEGWRDNRIEAVQFNTEAEYLIWDGAVEAQIYDDMKYSLSDQGYWECFESGYGKISENASEIIASSINVYDKYGILALRAEARENVFADDIVCALPAGNVGEVIGTAVNTDIYAYINHAAIPSYAVFGGFSAIAAEDLRDYGFDVVWSADERTLNITRSGAKYMTPRIFKKTAEPNTYFCDILQTDIRVYLNGIEISAYAADGVMMVPLEAFRAAYAVDYSDSDRALRMTVPDLDMLCYMNLNSTGIEAYESMVREYCSAYTDMNGRYLVKGTDY